MTTLLTLPMMIQLLQYLKSMSAWTIFPFNEVGGIEGCCTYMAQSELYDRIQWDKNAVIEYYGKDFVPLHIFQMV